MKKVLLLVGLLIIVGIIGSYFTSNNIDFEAAHKQYDERNSGVKSSYLPRVGETKGDHYNNCINEKFYKLKNPIDFCSWHAGIGKYK